MWQRVKYSQFVPPSISHPRDHRQTYSIDQRQVDPQDRPIQSSGSHHQQPSPAIADPVLNAGGFAQNSHNRRKRQVPFSE